MPRIVYELVGEDVGFSDVVDAGTTALGSLAASATAASVATKELLDNVFGRVDQVNTWAAATGLSAQTITALTRAARVANKDLGQLIPQGFAKRMTDVARGTGEAGAAMKALGFDASEVEAKLSNADALFAELLGSILALEDPLLKASLAEQVFGENGREMLSAFSDLAGFESFMMQADRWGVDVGPVATAQSNAWWAATANLNVALEEVSSTLAGQLAPTATGVLNEIAFLTVGVGTMITETIRTVEKRVNEVRTAFALWRDGLFSFGTAAEIILVGPGEALEELNVIVAKARAKAIQFWEDVVEGAQSAGDATRTFSTEVDITERKVSAFLMSVIALSEQMRAKATADATKLLEQLQRDGATVEQQLTAVFEAADKAGDRMLEQAEQLAAAQRQIAVSAASDMLGTWTDYFSRLSQLEVDRTLTAQQAAVDRMQAEADELAASEHASRRQVEAAQGAADEQRRIANAEVLAAFERSQDWARGQVGINAATAAIGMIAQMAPFIGPASVAVAAGILVPQVNLQLAEINAQQPPTVRHGGGLLPGEVSLGGLRALFGEAGFVFNQDAVRNGALQRAAAENQRRPADGPAGRRMELVLPNSSGRAIARLVLEEASRPGSEAFQATTAGQPLGYTNPYRKG